MSQDRVKKILADMVISVDGKLKKGAVNKSGACVCMCGLCDFSGHVPKVSCICTRRYA